jgi:hypothetical protein
MCAVCVDGAGSAEPFKAMKVALKHAIAEAA